MGDLDRIVDVTITKQTATPSIASFDSVLIASEFLTTDVTPNYGSTERVRLYTSLSDIGTGFGTSSTVYLMAAALFAQNPSINKVYIGRKLTGGEGSETWTAALTAMNVDNPAWYGVLVGTRTLAEQQLVAAWVEANKRICVLSSDDSNIPDGTGDIAEYVNTQNYERTGVIYHPDSDLTSSDPFPDCAWMGKMFPYDPGEATWAFKTLAGVASYTLTGAQITTIEGKNGNYYTEVASIDITQFGTVGSGEYFDIIRGLDWLAARIQQLVFTSFVNNEKIPFTDVGIGVITGQVRAGLGEAVNNGLITDDYTVSAPLAADVSATDKGDRYLPDVTFIATLQGAVHSVEINGTVSF